MAYQKVSTTKLGKKGIVVIPAELRRRFGLKEGSLIIIEETADGIVIRPAVALPVEIYSPERQAEFLLSNATTEDEYEAAREEVIGMGLCPDSIEHHRP